MSNINLNNIYEWPFKRQSIIFGLIFLIVIYLGYSFDLSSFSVEISNNQDEQKQLVEQVKIIVNKEIQTQKNIKQLMQAEELLIDWRKKLIRYEELPKLLDSILKIGATNQLYFSSFTLNAPAAENSYVKIPIKTVVVGSYHQIATFLSQLANYPSIVVIDNFTMQYPNESTDLKKKGDDIQGNETMMAEIMLAIYYSPEGR